MLFVAPFHNSTALVQGERGESVIGEKGIKGDPGEVGLPGFPVCLSHRQI